MGLILDVSGWADETSRDIYALLRISLPKSEFHARTVALWVLIPSSHPLLESRHQVRRQGQTACRARLRAGASQEGETWPPLSKL